MKVEVGGYYRVGKLIYRVNDDLSGLAGFLPYPWYLTSVYDERGTELAKEYACGIGFLEHNALRVQPKR